MDLDGTLIKTDLMWESLVLMLSRNPFRLFSVFLWWTRGRAFLKQKLAARVQVNAETLPYNQAFLKFLRSEKQKGRILILATASDRQMAQPVFDYVGLFDELLASDGKTNLRGPAKLKTLTGRFGGCGFDYAGNSSVDLPVWAGAREAVVVNARRKLVERVSQKTKLGPTFIDGFSPLFQSIRILHGLFIESRYLYAMLAGLLLTAAFPKIGIAGFAWIAPALMLAAAWGITGADAFRIGYVAGLAHFLSSLYWLLLMPVMGFPILGWLALCAYLALYPAIWTWFVSRTTGPTLSWFQRTLASLTGAAAWVALEMIRARFLTGFPWNPLGASQFQLVPLIQIASVTGVYGVSFLIVWTSLSLFSAAHGILQRPAARNLWMGDVILPAVAVLVVFAFGIARLRGKDDGESSIRVTFIQPAIPQTMIWDQAENENRFRQVIALSEHALSNKTDLLLWPEAALPEFNETNYDTITNLIRTHDVWMIFGADDVERRPDATDTNDYDDYNAAHLFDPDGRYVAVYRKQRLVIFGEYIPLIRWLPFIKWLTPIEGGFAAGDRPVPFLLGNLHVKTSVLICFEDVFPQLVTDYVDDDTDFLVNLTNDGWFGNSAEQWQHATTAAFRAVENGLPLLRCCNNGITCWVDSHGRMRDILHDAAGSVYGVGSMTVQVPILTPGRQRPRTIYNQYGDWFGWSCVGLATIALVAKSARR